MMANKVVQKTFKIEFVVTVDIEEVGEEHLRKGEPVYHLPRLKRLQNALVNNKVALVKQCVAKALDQLQEYVDYLANQDNLVSLAQTAAALETEDREFFLDGVSDFSSLTRPIRSSAFSVRMAGSTISEQEGCAGESESWRPVWSDLLLQGELGKSLRGYLTPRMPARSHPATETSHYLLARYLTRQCDGVHFEARCSCGKYLEGMGANEELALVNLWEAFRVHRKWIDVAERMRLAWKNLWRNTYSKC